MTNQSETKSGQITPYKKVCVIEKGVITRMYWEHPSGNDDFDHNEVINRWVEMHGKNNDFTTPEFLNNHGFYRSNVIRDGVRPTS